MNVDEVPQLRFALAIPARRPRPFALTPLVDVIFLLLIFFMLSSQILPYSLLTLTPAAASDGGQERVRETGLVIQERPTLLLIVRRGTIRAGANTIKSEELGDVLDTHEAPQKTPVTLLLSRNATVQDLATALGALTTRKFASVSIVGGVR